MEIRPLTREEQLIWLKGFLEEQIRQYQLELEECNKELEEIQTKKLVKTKSDNQNKN